MKKTLSPDKKVFLLFVIFFNVSIKNNVLSSPTDISVKSAEKMSTSYTDEAGFSLNGREIRLDGKPFYPKGYVFESVINKREDLIKYATQSEYEEYCVRSMQAQDFYFGEGEFVKNSGTDLAREWGANILRFNLNQAALDPQNEFYSATYVEMVQKVVKTALDKDFPVILSLFGSANKNIPEPMRNENPAVPMNTKTSLRAAVKLAELFGKNPRVMLELVNEPYPVGTLSVSWTLYIDGGIRTVGTFKGWEFVGVNTIIKAMRDKGAENLIIVQGVGASFKSYPGGITDPLNKLVFSVHPFFGDGTDPDAIDWDGNFGFMADKYPFIITAWGAPLSQGWCPTFGLEKPIEFLDYIKKKNIGIMAYAMDVPFTTVRDFRENPVVPTTLGTKCTTWAGRGAGEVMRDYFLSYNYTSVNELSTESLDGKTVSVFPNPVTNGKFSIEKIIDAPVKIQLYNILGDVVYAMQVTQAVTHISNLQLSPGIYLMKTESANNTAKALKIVFE
ncbi:MAG: cellulase family glycosylhydrolase [Paludibacter sp.]|nr:cellulase family glycosylhydrolase [Paludibacter sp.]